MLRRRISKVKGSGSNATTRAFGYSFLKKRTDCQNAKQLQLACKDFAPEIVHSFSRLLYLAPVLLDKLAKVMSYQRHATGYQIKFAELCGGRSLAFTGCSEFIVRAAQRYGGVWQAIPNFVDTELFSFSPAVSRDAPLIFIGRVEQIKGTHVAIEIAKRSGRHLLIAGNHETAGSNGQYWRDVIVPELGKNGIEYVGPVDDVHKIKLLQSATAMIAPIQWEEPFGIVFIEALACGTPIISSPRGALPEIITDGIEGYLINDVTDGCRALQKIDLIQRAKCRIRAEIAFSAKVVVKRYERLYTNLLTNLAI